MSAGPNIYAHHAASVLRECGGSYAKARARLIAARNGPTEFTSFYNAALRALEIAEENAGERVGDYPTFDRFDRNTWGAL